MRRVIKVGGSLLLRPDLPESLSLWIARQSTAENLIVIGGGKLIDAIRQLDQLRPGDPIETHWRCVDLLEVTRQIVSTWFDWESILTGPQLQDRITNQFSRHRPTLVAVKSFYDRGSTCDAPLDWRTTSDTIAAVLAKTVHAEELILLKSCAIDPRMDLIALAQQGIVDESLLRFRSRSLSIRVEQLV